jgi:two-component system OmpR family sensor kinase
VKLRNSFRGRLAIRIAVTVMLLGLSGAALGYLVLRGLLYDQLDSRLRRLAEIEAAATADSPDETVHFHEELFVEASDGEAILPRYAQVWTLEGEPVAGTGNLKGRTLPLPVEVRERVSEFGKGEFFGFEWEGAEYRGFLYPLGIVGPQHSNHLLEVVAPTGPTETVLRQFLRMLAVLVLLGMATAYMIGWWLAGHAVEPLMDIISQAESLNVGRVGQSSDLEISADARTYELGRLVSVLNSMLARVDSTFEMQRRFLADAGHEIRTPLTILRGDIEVALRRDRSSEEYKAVLEQALDDLRGVSSLADDLITLARSDSGGLQPQQADVSLRRTIDRVTKKYASAADNAGVRLDVEVRSRVSVKGDPALLERAIANLVDNAIRYSGKGRRVSVRAGPDGDGQVRIQVSDDGPGIPDEERARVFERFYRGDAGRRSARGSGLGLAIVKAIIESHGGTVDLASRSGRGTTVSIVLPRNRSADRERPVA